MLKDKFIVKYGYGKGDENFASDENVLKEFENEDEAFNYYDSLIKDNKRLIKFAPNFKDESCYIFIDREVWEVKEDEEEDEFIKSDWLEYIRFDKDLNIIEF